MAGIGTYQIVDEDLTTVRFDMNDASGAANPGGLKTIARELHLRLPELEAVRFAPSSRPGGRTVFARDPLAVTTWKQAVLGSANNTYDEGAKAFNELTRLLRAGGVIKFTPEGSTETRFIDFEPSDGVALFGDEPEDVFRALTSHAYPDGAPVTIIRQPHLRIAELDPAVNVLANPTLLLDRDGSGVPDGWGIGTGDGTATFIIVAAEEALEIAHTSGVSFAQVFQVVPVAVGETWTISGEMRKVSGAAGITCRLEVFSGQGAGLLFTTTTESASYSRLSATGTIPSGTTTVEIKLTVANGVITGRFRRIQFEKSASASRFRCSAQAFSNDPTLLGQGRILPIWIEGDAPCPIKLRLSVSTNHMTKNQSDIETDTTGWSAFGAAISRVTSEQQQGAAALQIVTNNTSPNEGFTSAFPSHDIPVVSGRRYTFSVYLKRALGGTVDLRIEWIGGSATTTGPTVTLTGTWTRHSLSGTPPAGTTHARVSVGTNQVQQALTFFADAAQFEEGPIASAWVAGDSGNAAAALYASRSSNGFVGKRRLADLLNRHHFRAAAATVRDQNTVVVTDAGAVGGSALETRHRVQYLSTDGNSTSPSATWPVATQDGNLQLLALFVDAGGTAPSITPPAGWTEIGSMTSGTTTAHEIWMRVYQPTLSAYPSRSGAETFTLGAALPWRVVLVEIDGTAAPAALVGVSNRNDVGSTAPTTGTTPGSTIVENYQIAFIANEGAATQSDPTNGLVQFENTTPQVGLGAYERTVAPDASATYSMGATLSSSSKWVAGLLQIGTLPPHIATRQRRFRQEVSTKLDSLRGSFDVFLRLRPLWTESWTFQLLWTPSLGTETTALPAVSRDWLLVGSSPVAWVEIPLGIITVPEGGSLAGTTLEVWAERTASANTTQRDFRGVRFGSLFLVPHDAQATIVASRPSEKDSWLGSELVTPDPSQAGETAGTIFGTEMELNDSTDSCAAPPRSGLVYGAGLHRFIWKFRNPSGVATVQLRITNRTTSGTIINETVTLRTDNVPETHIRYLTLVAGNAYTVGVRRGTSGLPRVLSIEHESAPVLVSTQAVSTDAGAFPPAANVEDSAGALLRPLVAEGPTPDLLEPGLNLIHAVLLDPEASGFEDRENVLSRTGTLSVTHAPRFYE